MQESQTLGYLQNVSYRSLEFFSSEATYLGYQLRGGKNILSQSRIAATLRIPAAKTKRQAQEFLSAARYYCLWIPEFTEIARSLYTNTKRGTLSLIRTETKKCSEFCSSSTTPQHLKNLSSVFPWNKIHYKEVLTQTLGLWKCTVTYLSFGSHSHRIAHLSKSCSDCY